MAAPRMSLEDLLLRHGAVTQEQLDHAKAEQANWGGEIGRTLVELGMIPEVLLMKAYAHLYGIPMSQPDREAIPKEVLARVSVQLCEQYGVIPVGLDEARKSVRIASSRPTDKALLTDVSKATGLRVDFAAAPADAIERAIRIHFYGEAPPAPSAPPASTPTASGSVDGAAQFQRMLQLEANVEEVRTELSQLGAHHPGFASLTGRVEKLEQELQSEGDAVRALVGVLLKRGLIGAEEVPPSLKPQTGKVALLKLPLAKKPG